MKDGEGVNWIAFAGVAVAAFYLLFKKTVPTASEVFRKRQEQPPQPVAGMGMSHEDVIPKNAAITYAGKDGVPAPKPTTGVVENPFRENTNQDGLPEGFKGSFDDDPDRVDLGEADGGESPDAEEA